MIERQNIDPGSLPPFSPVTRPEEEFPVLTPRATAIGVLTREAIGGVVDIFSGDEPMAGHGTLGTLRLGPIRPEEINYYTATVDDHENVAGAYAAEEQQRADTALPYIEDARPESQQGEQ